MATSKYSFRYAKLSDQALLDALEDMLGRLPHEILSVNFQCGPVGSFQVKPEDLSQDPTLSRILALRTSAITSIQIILKPAQSKAIPGVHPNQSQPLLTVDLTRPEKEWSDQATFSPGTESDQGKYLSLIEVFTTKLGQYDAKEWITQSLGEDARSHYESRETFLRRQEDALSRFVEANQEFFRQQAERNLAHLAELDGQFAAKSKELAAEHDKKRTELEARETALESRKKELDDRDNTHARRATQVELKKKLTERSLSFKLTNGTRLLRLAPLATTVGLLGLLVFGVYYFSRQDPAERGQAAWISQARFFVLTASAGVTATFLIRIQQRFFQRHADEEFRLKRLDLDIDRATWLVELALEWKSEKGEEMPAELVDRLSRNLFADEGERDTDVHPLETLASALLGNAGSASLDMPGGKASFNRSDLKRMGKEEKA